MKKLLFWMVLIVGTVALLGSCAKKDEITAAAAGNVAGTGTTASGTITGTTVTGTFHTSWLGRHLLVGVSPIALQFHSLVILQIQKVLRKWIVTGTSTYTVSRITYSDATCSDLWYVIF